MSQRTVRSWLALLASLTCVSTSLTAQDFKKEVIYQIITDRFFDGDPGNNDPPQSRGMYDATKTNWQAYWGGDLAGIKAQLPYLHELGVTALWISPPVDNSNAPWLGPDGKPVPYLFAPYHGYGARDFKRIDEHFGSAANDWAAFDELAAAAHALGIKIIVDFSPNDSNLINTGEFGRIYDDGVLLGTYSEDTLRLFHHNGPLTDWRDPYQMQYLNVFDLADFDHQNPIVDRYIKEAITRFQDHGADAFRIDAVKHMSWGWVYSLADAVRRHKPVFVFAEWFQESATDKLYPDFIKFSRNSGIPLMDYPFALAVRDVFINDQGFDVIARVLDQEDRDFAHPNDLLTFVDNHDIPRLLSINDNRNRLHEALALVLTARGIPIVYYGDEQYLHNDTNGGRDPYTRPWMPSFDQTTVGYRLIQRLAALRKSNDALAYGSMRSLRAGANVYVFERRFANSVVVVAINKSDSTTARLTALETGLPAGDYEDYLGGLLGGTALRVAAGGTVATAELAPHSVAVWQLAAPGTVPVVGSVGPPRGQPGLSITLAGTGFGARPGTVAFGGAPAEVISWSDARVVVRVPAAAPGDIEIVLGSADGARAQAVPFRIVADKLIPVTFTLQNPPALDEGGLYVSGALVELGAGRQDRRVAPGPFLCPRAGECFLDISLPAGARAEYRYFVADAAGNVKWQDPVERVYTVPANGTGHARVVR